MASFEAALEDSDLTSVRSELALIDVRIQELVQSLDVTNGATNLELLKKLIIELKKQLDPTDETLEAPRAIVELLEQAIQSGYNDRDTWSELNTFVEQRRRLSETEVRRAAQLHQNIPLQKVFGILSAAADVFRKAVTQHAESRIANAILRDASVELNRLVHAASSSQSESNRSGSSLDSE